MRLWDISMLSVLPREQLVSQWRECSALASNIQKKGNPNHILCNFIMDYDYDHFISYTYYLREEMTSRGYRTINRVWEKIISLKPNYAILNQSEVYPIKFDTTYKYICYFNLLEKYICGGIREEDWTKIKAWGRRGVKVMKVIKDMSCDIEDILEMADKNIRLAVKYKEEDPDSSKVYYSKSVEELNSIKPFHDRIVAIIKKYHAEKGEPPAPMMTIYNYEHEKHMDKNASIRKLQELYSSGL